MAYMVKEITYTLQGEGANTGRPAVFLRFAGCNLWSGRDADRAGAICQFCDTDFVGTDGPNGGRFETAEELAEAVASAWPSASFNDRMVVITGGEPLLQLDDAAVAALHRREFYVAIETNGTRPIPRHVDWVVISPKAGVDLVANTGNELKLVYPQVGAEPARFNQLDFDEFRLQPMDGPERVANTAAAVAYCLTHPQWQLSLQTHKYLGIR